MSRIIKDIPDIASAPRLKKETLLFIGIVLFVLAMVAVVGCEYPHGLTITCADEKANAIPCPADVKAMDKATP